jgi:polysaccharide export outer membrane protein
MQARPAILRAFVLALPLLSGACMPASGPAGYAVQIQAQDQTPGGESLPYALVNVTPSIMPIISHNTPHFAGAFPDRRPPNDIRFGVGDIVSVTIFEAAAGGLFIPAEAGTRPGNYVTIPNQAVDSQGNIEIPYAGAIRAKGRTVVEVQQAIVDALKNRAIEPQAVVSIVDQRTSMISVLGDVRTASRFPASAGGEHILDAITRAGGPTSQGFDSWVMLERGGRRAAVPFGALVYAPANNIFVHPGDTIYLFNQPQTYLAFGATGGGGGGATGGRQAQVSFGAWQLSLAEAIAKAGGLDDASANPATVFLYRGETRATAEKLGVDVSKFEGPIIPIIYNLNLRDPSGYFMATGFPMHNKDVIYVANANSVQITKFLTFLRLIIGTADDPIIAAINAYTLKAATKGAFETGLGVVAP